MMDYSVLLTEAVSQGPLVVLFALLVWQNNNRLREIRELFFTHDRACIEFRTETHMKLLELEKDLNELREHDKSP